MTILELEIMRKEFGDIPTDSDDEIETDFYFGKKGHIDLTCGIGLMKNCRMDWL